MKKRKLRNCLLMVDLNILIGFSQLYKGERKTYRLLDLLVPQFPHLQFEDYNSNYLIGLLWGINELIFVSCLE